MTKTLIVSAIVMMSTSFAASAHFAPWENAKYREAENQEPPAVVSIGSYYRDDSQVEEETPDLVQSTSAGLGPFYLRN